MGGPIFNQPIQAQNNQTGGFAVKGISTFDSSIAVNGQASGLNSAGTYGQGTFGAIGLGIGSGENKGVGVRGSSSGNVFTAVDYAWNPVGVLGESSIGEGVVGASNGDVAAGVAGRNLNKSQYAWAGYFEGRLFVMWSIIGSALHSKIDHPLDPVNKYLYHSTVESSDMKNLYDGRVTLDDNGEAEIELPDWFSALNREFRYQLTPIGAPGSNLHIAEEISEGDTNYSSENSRNNKSHFKIAGGSSGMRVSWQVTGVRKDPWATVNSIKVEENKSDEERGYYLHPEVYGQPTEKRISRSLLTRKG